MPLLLMIFLLLVCLVEIPHWPKSIFPIGVEASAGLTALSTAAVALSAWAVARRVHGPLERDPSLRDRLLPRQDRERFAHRIFLFASFGVCLLALGWGHTVNQLWRLDAEHPLPGADLIVLAPFLIGLVLSWAFYYDADREAHRAAHRLLDLDPLSRAWLEQLPTPVGVGDPLAFGGRASYVLFQVRQKLALAFVPLSVLLVQKDLRRLFPEQRDQWESVTSVIGAVAVGGLFLGMPYLLRLLLGLKPLPAGPLRDRLERASIRLRLRLSDFLLWDTRGAMANAFVVGLTPWLRYVVFTDRLLEEFTHEETEAVLGHEVGHIKHRHMLFYLAFLTMSLMALWTATLYFQLAPSVDDPTLEVESSLAYGPVQAQYLRALPLVGVALAYLFGVFGLLSRWCERQADVFGCRAVSCARRDCDGHTDDQLLPTGGKGLCRTGVRTFVQALEKVAVVNGISRDRPGFFQSWQHSTIARRVAFLERIAVAPSVERGFQIQIAVMQWGLILALVVWLTWASCSGG